MHMGIREMFLIAGRSIFTHRVGIGGSRMTAPFECELIEFGCIVGTIPLYSVRACCVGKFKNIYTYIYIDIYIHSSMCRCICGSF